MKIDSKAEAFIASDEFEGLLDSLPETCGDKKPFIKKLVADYSKWEGYPIHFVGKSYWEEVYKASDRVSGLLDKAPDNLSAIDSSGDWVSAAAALTLLRERARFIQNYAQRQVKVKLSPGRKIEGYGRYYFVSALLPYLRYKWVMGKGESTNLWGWLEEFVGAAEKALHGAKTHKKGDYEVFRQWWDKAAAKMNAKYGAVQVKPGELRSLAREDGVFESAFAYLNLMGIERKSNKGKAYLKIIAEEMPFFEKLGWV